MEVGTMDAFENIVALLCLTAISIASIKFISDAGGKDVALALGGAMGGYLVKTVRNKTKKKTTGED